MFSQIISPVRTAANDAANPRSRTVPITQTITPVPGYPSKLVVFKMAASKYWQARCWIDGYTHRKTTKTQSLRLAQAFARRFYEQLLAQSHGCTRTDVSHDTSAAIVQQRDDQAIKAIPIPKQTFAAIAAQMFAAEQARVDRGEFSRGSLMVL